MTGDQPGGASGARWFRTWGPGSAPELGGPALPLVCFAHAGGSASFFRRWVPRLPAGIQLLAAQLPGREDRIHEVALDHMDPIADAVATALAAMQPGRVALFGHSLGAIVAYEVACRLEVSGSEVVRLFVSGRPGPGRDRPDKHHLESDDLLWAEVCRLGGVDDELAHLPGLRALVLPTLRQDYRVSETYRPRRGERLACPVTVMLGADDPEVSLDEAMAWAEVTTGPVDVAVLPGDHFYLRSSAGRAVQAIVDRLAPLLREARRAASR